MSGRFQLWGLSPASGSRGTDANSSGAGASPGRAPGGGAGSSAAAHAGDTSADHISHERMHAPLPMNPDEAMAHDARFADTSFASSSASSRPGSSDGTAPAPPTLNPAQLYFTPLHPTTPRQSDASITSSSTVSYTHLTLPTNREV